MHNSRHAVDSPVLSLAAPCRPLVTPFACAAVLLAARAAAAQSLSFVDVNSSGVQTSGQGPALSSTGRYVAFGTDTAIDPADTNPTTDVYLRDRQTGVTSFVSRTSAGGIGNAASFTDTTRGVSVDGRYVLFVSLASNMVAGDTNGAEDLFLRDRTLGTTIRVSVGNTGQQGNLGMGTGDAWTSRMSDDGRYVAFTSSATNLAAGGDTNASPDVFRFDRLTLTSTLVSASTGGGTGNGWSGVAMISGDGRYVAFESSASNLVAGDANGALPDAFVRDMLTGTTTIVGRGTPGNAQAMIHGSGAPSLSFDGRYVAFTSWDDLTPETHIAPAVYVRDRTTNVTTLVSPAFADGNAFGPQISGDGSAITYISDSSNLAPGHFAGQLDVYRSVRASGWTTRVSSAAIGIGQGTNASQGGAAAQPGISFDGRLVVWSDYGTNLIVPDAFPISPDVFLWRETPPPPVHWRRFP